MISNVFALGGYFLLLFLSFYFLYRITETKFVSSIGRLKIRLGLSAAAAGATLVAMGSSAPEFFVSAASVVMPGEHASVGMGSIVGSAIFNVLVIIGCSAIFTIMTMRLLWKPFVRDMIFYIISILLLILSFADGKIYALEAWGFVGAYAIYIGSVIKFQWKSKKVKIPEKKKEVEEESKILKEIKLFRDKVDKLVDKIFPNGKHYTWVFFISILYIAGLSWIMVESAVAMANILKINSVIIAILIIAPGTSIPDLISSIVLARKGQADAAVSNGMGSNIFDILAGIGVVYALALTFGRREYIVVETANLYFSVILLFATVVALFAILLATKWKLGKPAGWFLVGLYVAYLIFILTQALIFKVN